jgi:hypothetical protein
VPRLKYSRFMMKEKSTHGHRMVLNKDEGARSPVTRKGLYVVDHVKFKMACPR